MSKQLIKHNHTHKQHGMPHTRQRQQAAGAVEVCGNDGARLVLVLILARSKIAAHHQASRPEGAGQNVKLLHAEHLRQHAHTLEGRPSPPAGL